MEYKHMFLIGFIVLYECNVNGFVVDRSPSLVELIIQAEEMEISNGSVNHRSKASNFEVVHLYAGSRVSFDFCLLASASVNFNEVVYSNDGLADKIAIHVDNIKIGEFNTVPVLNNGGLGWNMFRSSGDLNSVEVLAEGRHKLILTVEAADIHGVEIDFSRLTIDTSQNVPSLKCNAFCFDEISYTDDLPFPSDSHQYGHALQKSTPTACAEVDNINIPVFHPGVTKFVVSATMPKYTSFSNRRGADWQNCQLMSAFWIFTSVRINTDITRTDGEASMSITTEQQHTNRAIIEVTFPLKGEGNGSTDAYIGTDVYLKDIRIGHLRGNITLSFQYLDKTGKWSMPQYKTLTPNDHITKFVTPDFVFSDHNSNAIRVEIEANQDKLDGIIIGEFYMYKRHLKNDVSRQVYKDSSTVIEGVEVDMWWRINETMTITLTDSNQVYTNFAYIRLYQRVPWADNSFSQVLVMYQDGNVRLLPITPHGLDWIPFGSSVLIGQSDPTSERPSAPIKHLVIDPRDLVMKIIYSDGGWLSMKIRSAFQETVLIINDSSFMHNTSNFPFFTFRSMWIADGNGDVDHVTVSGKYDQTLPVLSKWLTLKGNFFAFYRKCISKHNTLSPDILLKITG